MGVLYSLDMNTIINPKLLAFAQTLFYGFVTIAVPTTIAALGQDGLLNGFFSPAVTGVMLFVLNLVDNRIAEKTGKGMFGSIA